MCLCVCLCEAASDATRVIHVSVCLCVVQLQVMQQEPVTVKGVDMEKFFNKSYTCVCVFVCVQLQVMQ